MNKPLPIWLIQWLGRPCWQLLAVQWLVLAAGILLAYVLFISGQWQRRERLYQQQQQLQLQVTERQQQISQLPSLEALELSLQHKAIKQPEDHAELGSNLSQVGGKLLRWQQQDKPAQQTFKFQVNYSGLLRLLETISPHKRIDQIRIESRSEGVFTELTLLSSGDGADE
ncbi:hypothetical protein [Serratia sp. UGAL515B_01]|uniref:hypothetical protein n=1 Tax=Serratia sp. UGAL515B_01 TaxID=2986763 RepID=UPI0029538A0E|nr:hypothetical protein [Serratia sp. UGAL515B_01]WON76742.1 hypothetical protein OK023_16355 [Serratia sp. UGAL515B_01]